MTRGPGRIRRGARLALLAAVLGVACDDATGPSTVDALALQIARARWERSRPAAYTYEYQSFCSFCVGATFTWVRLTVSGGDVILVELAGDVPAWAPPPSLDPARYPTIDELFASIEATLAQRPDVFEADYDGDLGYPTRVAVDSELDAVDDEWGWEVRGVTPWEFVID